MEKYATTIPRSSKWLSTLIGLAVIMMVVSLLDLQKPPVDKTGRLNLVQVSDMRRNKSVYPYSVVPGGVHSRGDVRQVMAQDSSVNDHYEGVKTEKIQPVVLKGDLLAYVSYRKQGRIYWTKRPLRIEAGEAVLDDGQQRIRARCGNRISLTAQLPVITPESEEPAASEFDEAGALPLSSTDTSARSVKSALISDLVAGQSASTNSTTTRPSLTGSGSSGSGSGSAMASGGGGGQQPAGTMPGDFLASAPADMMDAILPTDIMPSTDLIPGQVTDFDGTVTELVSAPLQPYWMFALLPRVLGQRFPLTPGDVDVKGFDNQLLTIPLVPIEVIVEQILLESRIPGNNTSSDVVEASPKELPIPPVPEPQTYGLIGGGLALILLWAKRCASLRSTKTSP